MSVDASLIEGVIEGLAFLYKESSRQLVSEADFVTTLVLLGLGKDVADQMRAVKLSFPFLFFLTKNKRFIWKKEMKFVKLNKQCVFNYLTIKI